MKLKTPGTMKNKLFAKIMISIAKQKEIEINEIQKKIHVLQLKIDAYNKELTALEQEIKEQTTTKTMEQKEKYYPEKFIKWKDFSPNVGTRVDLSDSPKSYYVEDLEYVKYFTLAELYNYWLEIKDK